jgi:hypothetical protein
MFRIYLFISIALIVSLGVITKQCSQIKQHKRAQKELIHILKNDAQIIKQYRDEAGKQHTIIQASRAGNDALKLALRSGDSLLLEIKKDVKGLKRNLKNLESATKVRTVVTNVVNTHSTDTVYKGDTAARYYDLNDFPHRYGFAITYNDSINVEVMTPADLTVVNYWKRKWFLGAKKWECHVITDNPYVDVVGVKSIVKRK